VSVKSCAQHATLAVGQRSDPLSQQRIRSTTFDGD
jgi:hypothetical protein